MFVLMINQEELNMKLNFSTVTLIASLIIAGNAFASKAITSDVHPPFIKEKISEKGLTINYDLRSNADKSKISQKLVCIFEGFLGNVTYVENNAEKSNDNPFIGQQIYFTNLGKTWTDSEGLDSIDQYHVDAKAYIKIENANASSKAYATCFYQTEST